MESGLLRSYSIDERGKEHIYMFAPESWIIVDGFSAQKPCELSIDALKDSFVIQREKNVDTISETQKLINRLEILQ